MPAGVRRIDAAGRKWDCIVYVDKKTLKNATMTNWMSKEYPGLLVQVTVKGKYNDSKEILTEWKD